jgi:hypothetical protein
VLCGDGAVAGHRLVLRLPELLLSPKRSFCVEHVGKREVRFRRPDGRLIALANAGPPACGPGLERQHRVRRLLIDADTCKPRSLGDPLDYGIAVEGLLAKAVGGT